MSDIDEHLIVKQLRAGRQTIPSGRAAAPSSNSLPAAILIVFDLYFFTES